MKEKERDLQRQVEEISDNLQDKLFDLHSKDFIQE